jgi:hypothetical protein
MRMSPLVPHHTDREAFHAQRRLERNALVNESLWKDVPSADQMSTLQAMLDQAEVLTKLGVQFVRPITNFDTVWSA